MEHRARSILSGADEHTIGLVLGGAAFTIVSAPPPGVELPQPPIPFPFPWGVPTSVLSLVLKPIPLAD